MTIFRALRMLGIFIATFTVVEAGAATTGATATGRKSDGSVARDDFRLAQAGFRHLERHAAGGDIRGHALLHDGAAHGRDAQHRDDDQQHQYDDQRSPLLGFARSGGDGSLFH